MTKVSCGQWHSVAGKDAVDERTDKNRVSPGRSPVLLAVNSRDGLSAHHPELAGTQSVTGKHDSWIGGENEAETIKREKTNKTNNCRT
jgi:hypothetical protein